MTFASVDTECDLEGGSFDRPCISLCCLMQSVDDSLLKAAISARHHRAKMHLRCTKLASKTAALIASISYLESHRHLEGWLIACVGKGKNA